MLASLHCRRLLALGIIMVGYSASVYAHIGLHGRIVTAHGQTDRLTTSTATLQTIAFAIYG
jgi:hypothetical protein